MDPKTAAFRRIIATLVVIGIIFGLGYAFKKLVLPKIQEARVAQTSSATNYKTNVRIGVDSFPGYAVLRAPNFRDQLGRSEIGVQVIASAADDKDMYGNRMKALKKGDLDMAVFTIDSDIVSGVDQNALEDITIFLIIDESHGADSGVAYKQAIANASALNRRDAKIVATGNSPSETLARHLVANMLPALASEDWLVNAKSADDVLERMKKANKNDPTVYILWEPALSKALALPDVISIYDTSKLSGIIVDVLVVNRKFLIDQPKVVRAVEESYFRALHFHQNATGGMAKLVLDDAKLNGDILTEEQAKKIANGIQWKNTMENYAQMGLLSAVDLHGLPTMREMIASISQFLLKTGKLKSNPTDGHEQTLYYDGTLRAMQQANFHPGQAQDEIVRGVANLPALTDDEWKTLITVGDMDARAISFARGKADIEIQGTRDVKDVANRLKAWPTYYLTVIGHARNDGDPAANLELAKARSKSVVDELVSNGIAAARVKTSAEPSQTQSGTAQSVTFQLSQRPY